MTSKISVSIKAGTDVKEEHPIKRELLAHVNSALRYGGNTKIEEAVIRHGRAFKGIKRPKGYRLQRSGKCFANAGSLAYNSKGVYVEGFVSPPGQPPIHHAWVTLDGIHAIDATLKCPAAECLYFGIPFPLEVLQNWIERPGSDLTMLDPRKGQIEKLESLLEDAGLEFVSISSKT